MKHEDRRVARRRPVEVFFNKYIDGQPHACEALEISTTGLLARKIHEPDAPRACYAIELGVRGDGDRIWLCATPVWTDGEHEALGFVGSSPRDVERLEALLERVA